MKTFLKWAGNKQRIAQRILDLLPPGERLIEPFVGSGAIFLHSDYPSYILADSNPDLIRLYQTLQEEGLPFIEYCRSFFVPENNRRAAFEHLRRTFNRTDNLREKSALFLYLNRHGYNGLCRYNRKGIFNVPYGRYAKPYFPEKEMLAFWEKAERAEFVHAPFSQTMGNAGPGDVIYCDPPYVPLSATSSFTSYSAAPFGKDAQNSLALAARRAAQKGAHILLSNHDTRFTRRLYDGAQIESFSVQRFISSKGDQRGRVQELLALFPAYSTDRHLEKPATL